MEVHAHEAVFVLQRTYQVGAEQLGVDRPECDAGLQPRGTRERHTFRAKPSCGDMARVRVTERGAAWRPALAAI